MTSSASSSGGFQKTAASLTRASFFTMLINCVSALLTLGLHMLLARALGFENYSDFSYAFTWLTILALPGVLGLDTAAQRYVSSYQAVGNWAALRGFLWYSTRLIVLTSTVLAFCCAGVLAAVSGQMRPELTNVLGIAILSLPFSALLLFGVAVLRGLRSPVLAAFPRLIVRPAFIAIAVAALWFFSDRELSSHAGMLLDLLATLVALFFAYSFFRKKRPKELLSCKAENRIREWTQVSLPMLGIAIMQLLLRSTDTVLVGYFHGTVASGPYSAANRIALLAAFGLMAVNAVLPPLISRYYACGDGANLQRLVTLAARVTFAFSVIAALVTILLRKFILEAFGQEFGTASTVLVILCCGQLVNALTGSVGFVLSMTGEHRIVVVTLIGTTIGHVALCLFLIPRYGIEGAAFATAVSIAASNIVLAIRCRSTLSIDPSIFGLSRRTPLA
jgi:O-antigen/teichoic acid export membrane protein